MSEISIEVMIEETRKRVEAKEEKRQGLLVEVANLTCAIDILKVVLIDLDTVEKGSEHEQ